MKNNRVVVSGLGSVTAFGDTVEEFWRACLNGDSCVQETPSEWRHYYAAKSRAWSPLTLPDYTAYGLSRVDVLRYDPAVLNAVVAVDNAILDAGLIRHASKERDKVYALETVDRDRAGVFIGTGLGCISSAFNNYVPHLLGAVSEDLFAEALPPESEGVREVQANLKAKPRVNPFASCQSMANAIAAMISIRYQFRGASETLVYACAAGTAAVARAYRAIQTGELDIVIAGGSEYYGDRAGGVFMAFDRLQTLMQAEGDPDLGNRPFDRDRSGFLFSQGGAGIVVLESEEHARNRGVKPLASVRAASITSDAYSLAAISDSENAIELMLRKLLDEAGIAAGDVDYINAHGTSTIQNDPIEAGVIKRMFPGRPLVNSTKSILGHTIGASGALETIATVLSMRDGRVHGTRNLVNPVADLAFADTTVEHTIRFAINQSFGFGGHNVGVLLENPE